MIAWHPSNTFNQKAGFFWQKTCTTDQWSQICKSNQLRKTKDIKTLNVAATFVKFAIPPPIIRTLPEIHTNSTNYTDVKMYQLTSQAENVQNAAEIWQIFN